LPYTDCYTFSKMDQKPKKRKHFTFMVIPHDGSAPAFSFKIPHFALYLTLAMVAFSLVFVGSSFIYSSILTRKLASYHRAIAKNVEQQKLIDSFAEKTNKFNDALVELEKEDNQLRKLLGLKNWKSKIHLTNKPGSTQLEKSEQIAGEFNAADQKINERRASLGDLKSWVGKIQARFANTPSIWPLNGHIVSAYGYRVYPWRGFHTGLDISGSYGSPIRVTADGVVKSVGWRTGYGKTVEVDHGFGKSTLYAHLSKYAVTRGQKVKKGELICYVGNTGYTTGPHLHYEVKTAGRAINPYRYLNLNILSASRVIGN